ncbi:efflux RND transporter periplasmic adaptor subunit [Aneurinibacillus soli]|nr:efflux RND transporter periplasmic adaptor subunit [Aneurinibacillus soli]
MNNKVVLTAIPLLASVALFSGCSNATAPNSSGGHKSRTVPIVASIVKMSPVGGDLVLTGQLTASLQTKVVSKLSGKVSKVYVQTGDIVSAGEKLVVIDTTDLQSQLAQQKAAVKTAQDQVAKARSDARNSSITANSSVDTAKSNVDQATATLQQAQVKLHQQQTLFASGAIPKQNVNDAQDAVTNAQLKVASAQQALQAAQATYQIAAPGGNSDAQKSIRIAEDQLAQAEASVSSIQTQISEAAVTSPISGIVASRDVEVGGFASGSQSVVTLVQNNPIKVVVNVPETVINEIKVGSPVKVSVSAAGNKTFDAKISRISPVEDTNSKSYPVEVNVNNSTGVLKPGMVAQATIGGLSKHDAIQVPADSIVQTPDGPEIFTIENGIAHQHLVKEGTISSNTIEIVSGLKSGDKIAILGQELLNEGSKVKEVSKDQLNAEFTKPSKKSGSHSKHQQSSGGSQ